jgi:hypothetical protein
MTSDDRLLVPVLSGDVLTVGIRGEFDAELLQLLLEGAASCLTTPGFGALLLDLTLATPAAELNDDAIAQAWVEQLPGIPCAVLCGALAVDFAAHLAGLLALSAVPVPVAVFDTTERAAAWRRAERFAAIYREEAARRRTT